MSPCVQIPRGFLTLGGPVLRLDTSKGLVYFEWHSYCGPMPVTMRRGYAGNERVLPHNHPFWAKVTRWVEQGRVVRDGWCVVEKGVGR